MRIIGCDYHPGFQQVAFVDTDMGELQERQLEHREEAAMFRQLTRRDCKILHLDDARCRVCNAQ